MIQEALQDASNAIASEESAEKRLVDLMASWPLDKKLPDDWQRQLDIVLEESRQVREKAYEAYKNIIFSMSKSKED